MTSSPHILVVDDHKSIREPLAEYLQKHDFRVSTAASGSEMNRLLKCSAIDLMVLDILMPGESGLEICRRVRATRDIPIILLTAMIDDTDIIVGLEMGADDYVTKPFNPRELLARIKNVLRRANSLPRHFSPLESGFITFGEWMLNADQHSLRRVGVDEDEAIPLSTADFKLLSTFLKHPKIVLSRDQLLDLTGGRSGEVFDRSIDNQVSRLRKKIEHDPKNPLIIKTIWGGGYMLTEDVVQT